jgi:hypothetical protein
VTANIFDFVVGAVWVKLEDGLVVTEDLLVKFEALAVVAV